MSNTLARLNSSTERTLRREINITIPANLANRHGYPEHKNIPAGNLTCPKESSDDIQFALWASSFPVINLFNECNLPVQVKDKMSFEIIITNPENKPVKTINLTGMDNLIKQCIDSNKLAFGDDDDDHQLDPSLPNLFSTVVLLQLPERIGINNGLGSVALIAKQSLVCPSDVHNQKEFALCSVIKGVQQALNKHSHRITPQIASNLTFGIILIGPQKRKEYKARGLSGLDKLLNKRLELEPSAAYKELVVSPNFDEGVSGMFPNLEGTFFQQERDAGRA